MINLGQKGFAPVVLVLAIAVLGLGGFIGYQLYKSNSLPNLSRVKSTIPTTKKVAPKPKASAQRVTPPRSKAPGIINAALTAHGYNPKTGSAIKPDKYFSPKDNKIYLLMNVNKPKVGTRIEYVRYLHGKYLDHKSLKVTAPNWVYAYFGWNNKPDKLHPKGIYRVRVYTNGILEQKLNYIVRSS